MAVKRIPPRRSDAIIDTKGRPTQRLIQFLESMPDQSSAVADVTVSGGASADEILLANKINELLAELRVARMIEA